MARQVGHSSRGERLQVQYNILLLKITTLGRQVGHYIRDERFQVEGNILLLKNNHSCEVGKTQ